MIAVAILSTFSSLVLFSIIYIIFTLLDNIKQIDQILRKLYLSTTSKQLKYLQMRMIYQSPSPTKTSNRSLD